MPLTSLPYLYKGLAKLSQPAPRRSAQAEICGIADAPTLLNASDDTVRNPAPEGQQGTLPACLIHIYPNGPKMGSRHDLGSGKLLIGREASCGLCVSNQSVSRIHARIEADNDGYVIVDLDSTNGTFVNNQPITRHRLQDGDYVRLGQYIFRFLSGGNVEAEYHEELYRLTIMDPQTQVHNHRHLVEFLHRELSRSQRFKRSLAVVMLDIDLFKKINDERGHLAGDHTLRELVDVIKPFIREEELLARFGGEEFVVVLPEATHEEALQTAERLRSAIEDHVFRFDDEAYQVTVSAGIAVTDGTTPANTSMLLSMADRKLYEAKRRGRNQVCV